jgi:adenosylcobinamide-GDP ribazoletransferase
VLADLAAAVTLLTRVPVWHGHQGDLAQSVWAFPVVGGCVGAIGGVCFWAATALGLSPMLAAAWSLAAMVALCGGLHEDGLADTADGFGGGGTAERKLAIMRDSRIGSYGVLALILTSVMRLSAVAALGRPGPAAIGLVLAGAMGRGAMIVPYLLLPTARPGGLGAAMGRPHAVSCLAGLALTCLLPCLLLPFGGAIVTAVCALGTSAAVARLAARQIGGYTGDVLGATAVVVDCVVLSVVVCLQRA